jgi:peptide deformylase
MITVPDTYKIWLYGSKRINVESEPVWAEDYDQLPELYEYMRKCMRLFNGMGIAAPQVGVFKQYCLVERLDGTVIEMVNPEITRMYGKEIEGFEACLSLPPGGNGCLVPRQEFISVEYGTRNTRTPTYGVFGGRDSIVAQHEIDHLTGTFFIDRASRVAKQKVLEAFENYRKVKFNYAENNSRSLSPAFA